MNETWGRIAYEAYSRAAAGRSLVTGAELPAWPDLPDAVQGAWDAAADAVAAEFLHD